MREVIISLILIVSTEIWAQESQNTANTQAIRPSISFDFGFHDIEIDKKIEADLIYKYFLVGGSYGGQKDKIEEGDFQHKNTQRFDAHIGGDYSYFFGPNFFIEGRLILGYAHAFHKYLVGMKTEEHISGFGRIEKKNREQHEVWKTWGEGDIYVGVTPRIGLKFDNVSIVAGYRWDFAQFKFDKDHRGDYCTIGLIFDL